MTFSDFYRYQYESIRRAELPPIASHTKTKQPSGEAA
ncbi:hypothetical protein NFJ01_04290 [Lelliottia amnigena]|nr:hypothetical protein [Lelliottia amnigena]USR61612.1 hypothetical protein NFJ01_04290 [Lelliottia amnigena]